MKHTLLAMLIMIAGCSRPAPAPVLAPPSKAEFPRLETGQDAIVCAGAAVIQRIDRPEEPWRKDEPEYMAALLWEGDAVTVLDDKGNESEPHRWVSIRVERTGADRRILVGNNYSVRRREIQPKPH